LTGYKLVTVKRTTYKKWP